MIPLLLYASVETYFKILEENIQKGNSSFKDIKLIRSKILIQMQTSALDDLILKNNKFKRSILTEWQPSKIKVKNNIFCLQNTT